MNTEQILVMSICMIIGTIINVQLLNHNWFKRQELKSKYRVKEIRERARAKLPKQAPSQDTPSSLSSIPSLLNLAKGLEPEQLHDLVDTFASGSMPERSGDALLDIVESNPEIINSVLKGISKGKESKEIETFQSQM